MNEFVIKQQKCLQSTYWAEEIHGWFHSVTRIYESEPEYLENICNFYITGGEVK